MLLVRDFPLLIGTLPTQATSQGLCPWLPQLRERTSHKMAIELTIELTMEVTFKCIHSRCCSLVGVCTWIKQIGSGSQVLNYVRGQFTVWLHVQLPLSLGICCSSGYLVVRRCSTSILLLLIFSLGIVSPVHALPHLCMPSFTFACTDHFPSPLHALITFAHLCMLALPLCPLHSSAVKKNENKQPHAISILSTNHESLQ